MRQLTVQTPYPVGEAHLYLTEIEGELVLFDTGPPTIEGRELLCSQVDLARLRHVFITHCHVDHYGLIHFIAEHSDAEIYLPGRDVLKLRHHERRLAYIEEEMAGLGFSREQIRRFRESVERNRLLPAVPRRFRVAEEAAATGRLGIEVLACPGHSQSDLVYFGGDWAVTGDTLLRGIFQVPLLDVDLQSFAGRFRNYAAYCESLRRLGALRGRRILPGHRYSVESLEACILFYVGKLCQRAARLKVFPAELPVSNLVERLFGEGPGDPFITYIKASEIVFMRDFLAEPERLRGALADLGLLARAEAACRAA